MTRDPRSPTFSTKQFIAMTKTAKEPRDPRTDPRVGDVLKTLRYRLSLARKRLVYWACLPSFTAKTHRPRGGTQLTMMTGYENALSDCQGISSAIGRITGTCPMVADIVKDFQQRTWARDAQIIKQAKEGNDVEA
jgi:hypothetical protein